MLRTIISITEFICNLNELVFQIPHATFRIIWLWCWTMALAGWSRKVKIKRMSDEAMLVQYSIGWSSASLHIYCYFISYCALVCWVILVRLCCSITSKLGKEAYYELC